MPDYRTTYELAAPQIARYVHMIAPGELAMPLELREQDGRRLSLSDDHLSGKHLVLLFLNDTSDELALPWLEAFGHQQAAIEQHQATLVAVSSCSEAARNRELRRRSSFPWPIVGDSTGAAFAAYGLHKLHGEAIRIVLVTPGGQIRVWFDTPVAIDDTLGGIMELLRDSRVAEAARWSPPHAPVLLVPNVLSDDECARLVRSFEADVPFTVRPPRPAEIASSYKIPVYEHDRQDRVDLIIRDSSLLALLDERIWGRVTPMIRKAFAFDVTRHEELHVARYAGARGGIRMGHRDNTSPATAYRRFALTINLNAGYEGGEIFFREYSPRGYQPEPGTALVFSSSLLHEVEEVRAGVRYALISHFFNEQSVPR